jgi:hypothetical protein
VIVIYLDIYFFINFCLDYIALFTAAMVFHIKPSTARLIFSSLVGGIISVILFICDSPLMTALLLPPSAYLMCLIIFEFPALKELIAFVCSGVFMGGTLTAFENLFSTHFRSPWVIAPAIILACIACFTFYIFQHRARHNASLYTVGVKIQSGGKLSCHRLLVDSGNLAFEPTTGRRIIILGLDASRKITLPEDTKYYTILIKTATGEKAVDAFIPENMIFDDERYNKEKFMLMPNPACTDFAGFDGIAPIIR